MINFKTYKLGALLGFYVGIYQVIIQLLIYMNKMSVMNDGDVKFNVTVCEMLPLSKAKRLLNRT